MHRNLTHRLETIRKRYDISDEHLLGFRYAMNVAIATTIVWLTLRLTYDSNPIWAIASMVAASDPQPLAARLFFRSRMINVLVGCAVGLAFLFIGGTRDWILPVALAVAVIISSYFVRIKIMWRQAPITAALVVAAGITLDSKTLGMLQGLHKVLEVIFGCAVGLAVSWLMSKVWIIKIDNR